MRFFVAALFSALALGQTIRIQSFSVGPDQTITYPNNPSSPPYLVDLPDEHTTFMPPASGTSTYLVFGASALSGGTGGAVALETTNLKTFRFATPLGYKRQVMTPPLAINQCDTTHQTEFDGNYAAPGSVLQDPTLPPGNLMMIYEAENHCPSGVYNPEYYATIGFARSSDNGKTWPAPVNSPTGDATRHPILQNSIPQPTTSHPPLGDAIPSAYVDQNAAGDYYLYVTYGGHTGSNTPNLLSIARAKLGEDPLVFQKWNNGSFSEPGIGGADTGFLPSGGCPGSQVMGEISYNDDLGSYMTIFVCVSGPQTARVAAWYYSTATSLDLQDWSTPQIIENSQFPIVQPCSTDGRGQQFDGWYPSSMSPGAASGHTKLSGLIFFQNGCDTGKRVFVSREFTIAIDPLTGPVITKVANAASESPVIAPNTWLEIKGMGLAPAGDTRTWQDSDFVGGATPTTLDDVSVTVNGKSAYMFYISPTQVNVLTPPDAMAGPVELQLTNGGVQSAPFTVQAAPVSPAFFMSGGGYVMALHALGGVISAGSPATPGETILLFGTGFGSTTEPLPVIKIGGITAKLQFAGPVALGDYQFAVVVPKALASGDQIITGTFDGAATQPGTLIAIGR